ncbi:hypothetical protein GJ496_009109 [Pomphorhynchus laevis]|nr:hypothetical protein GJ496_009109 [Pomphorhynchus laevis]
MTSSATTKRINMRSVISKEMIGHPKGDLIHTLHVGVTGETFGDLTYINRAMNALKSINSGGNDISIGSSSSREANVKKNHAIKFGRKVKSPKTGKNISQRTSITSDEHMCSFLPEEPFVDFGPSFYDEVMQALEERLPQYSVKSKYSDFVSSNECDFSDSESSFNKDDFSETSGSSNAVDINKHDETAQRNLSGYNNEIVAQLTDNCGGGTTLNSTSIGSSNNDAINDFLKNRSSNYLNEISIVTATKREDNSQLQHLRKDSKWSRACRLPVNGMLLRTLGASSLSQSSSIVGNGASSNQLVDSNDDIRYKISAPVHLITDSRIVKSSTIPVKPSTLQPNSPPPPPPLPSLASLGAKLTSAESLRKNRKFADLLSATESRSTKINS